MARAGKYRGVGSMRDALIFSLKGDNEFLICVIFA